MMLPTTPSLMDAQKHLIKCILDGNCCKKCAKIIFNPIVLLTHLLLRVLRNMVMEAEIAIRMDYNLLLNS